MASYRNVVSVSGDELSIRWDGNVWISPHNGQQHSRAEQAMRSELGAYFRACGEDPESTETAEQIEKYVSQMETVD